MTEFEPAYGSCPRCGGGLHPADLRPLGLFKVSVLQCEGFDRDCDYRRWIWGRELREVRQKFDSANNPPTSDIDVIRTAALLIKQHGERAALEAAGRIDDMIAKGDPKAEVVWKRVAIAVENLQKTTPPTKALH